MISTIVDLSHHNKDIDLKEASSSRLAAVIHKATQGTRFIDPQFNERRATSHDLNILFGAYHFGNSENGLVQAQHFLRCTGAARGLLRVLDVEENPSDDTIDLKTAENFVVTIHNETGIWPGLYSKNYLFELTKGVQDSPLYSCWLWCANYESEPVVPAPWKRWVLWQYTDGAQKMVEPMPGLNYCDRNKFNGSLTELKDFWSEPKIVSKISTQGH